jgi:hypothetical protein
MPENRVAGRKGGGIARKARVELEEKTGRSVVAGENFLPLKASGKIEDKDDIKSADKGRKKIGK